MCSSNERSLFDRRWRKEKRDPGTATHVEHYVRRQDWVVNELAHTPAERGKERWNKHSYSVLLLVAGTRQYLYFIHLVWSATSIGIDPGNLLRSPGASLDTNPCVCAPLYSHGAFASCQAPFAGSCLVRATGELSIMSISPIGNESSPLFWTQHLHRYFLRLSWPFLHWWQHTNHDRCKYRSH